MKKTLIIVGLIFILNNSVFASDKGKSDAASAAGASESVDLVRKQSIEELAVLIHAINQGAKVAAPSTAEDVDSLFAKLVMQVMIGEELNQSAENNSASASASAAQSSQSAAAAAPVFKPVRLSLGKDVMLHESGTLMRKVSTQKVGSKGKVTQLKAAFPIEHPSIEGFAEDVCTNAQCIEKNGPHKYFYDMSNPAYKAMQAKTAANQQK
jgi:hypothetical protein